MSNFTHAEKSYCSSCEKWNDTHSMECCFTEIVLHVYNRTCFHVTGFGSFNLSYIFRFKQKLSVRYVTVIHRSLFCKMGCCHMTGSIRLVQFCLTWMEILHVFICCSLNLPNMNVASTGLESCSIRHSLHLRGLRSLLQRLQMM